MSNKNAVSKVVDNKVVEYESNGEQIKLSKKAVKEFIGKGNDFITDQEIFMFMSLCKYQKLNPFLNEAFLVKYDKTKPAQNVVSKEAFMKRAYAQKNFDGFRAGIIIQRDNELKEVEGAFMLKSDKLLGGWAEVHVKDKKLPYIEKVDLDEYHKGQSTWKSMPKTMIRKVALVHALREAFPTELGGMYIMEEPSFNDGDVIEDQQQAIEENTASEQAPADDYDEETGEFKDDTPPENLFEDAAKGTKKNDNKKQAEPSF